MNQRGWTQRIVAAFRKDYVLGGTVSLISLNLYGALLDRNLGAWDTAEMQTVPVVFGVTHIPSYPLFTIIGGIWARVPVGSAIVRMNLLSSVLFAISAGLLVLLLRRLHVRRPVAAVAALVFAASAGVVTNATHIEHQSFHVVLLTGLLLATHATLADPTRRNLSIAAFIVGAGMAHHGLMTLTGPAVLAVIVIARRRALLRASVLGPSVAVGALPLLAYIYPVATTSRSRIVNVDSSSGWIDVFLARGGITGTMGTPESITKWIGAIPGHLGVLADWTGFVPVALAALGAAVIFRRQPAFGVAITLVAAIASYVQANASDIHDRYLLTDVLILALCAGVGVDRLVTTAVRRLPVASRPVALGAAALFAALPVVLVLGALRDRESETDVYRDNATRVLEALPPDCVLWAYWDVRTTLQYARFIDGVRPDVTILDHRSTSRVGSSFAATPEGVYDGIQYDSELAGRPVCHIKFPYAADGAPPGLRLVPLTTTLAPWGRDLRLGDLTVNLVEPIR